MPTSLSFQKCEQLCAQEQDDKFVLLEWDLDILKDCALLHTMESR